MYIIDQNLIFSFAGRLSNVIQYETLTLGTHTFTVGMTDVYGLTGKSEVAFFGNLAINQ